MRIVRFIGTAVLATAILLVAACTKHSNRFCCTTEESCAEFSGQPITPCTEPAQPYCDESGEHGPRHACIPDPNGCTGSTDCAAPFVCDVGGTNTCVECTEQEAAACTGTTPVCGDDLECRACTAHTECAASSACLPEGRCAEPDEVAYVQLNGSGGQPCARDAPCGALQEGITAVSATRRYIKISGTGTLTPSVTTTIDGKAMTILADPGAKLDRTGDGVILEVRNTGADVRIYDLEITGASGMAGDVGISMPAGGAPKLTLVRVKVTNNQGGGISVNGGTLTLSQSGVLLNSGGGVSVANAQFDVTNSVIARNGGAGSSYGGVLLSQSNNGMRRFEFNTIAQNQATAGVTPGVLCAAIGTPLTLMNSIVYDNGAGAQVEGSNCSWTYSDIGPMTASGTGNINSPPRFINPTQNDFHLQSGSPAQDTADTAATLAVDIDGEPRPQGARRDMGADEAP